MASDSLCEVCEKRIIFKALCNDCEGVDEKICALCCLIQKPDVWVRCGGCDTTIHKQCGTFCRCSSSTNNQVCAQYSCSYCIEDTECRKCATPMHATCGRIYAEGDRCFNCDNAFCSEHLDVSDGDPWCLECISNL